MMKRTKTAVACVAMLFSSVGVAQAAPISEDFDITASGPGSIGYFYFDVTGAGLFDIFTMGPTIDPVLYLLADDGSLDASDLIEMDDDGCSSSFCGPAGAFANSRITRTLGLGSYVAAVSDFGFSLNEVIAGNNYNNRIGLTSINVAANINDSGHALAVAQNTVPEPASFALLGAGLAGFGAAVRRKRLQS